jgi:succinate-acetate transporter protein
MPLGICMHGMNMLLFSLNNVQARKLTVMYVVVPLALFAGGVASLLASTASMYMADTSGYTVFGSNAGIWMAIGYNLLPSIRQKVLCPSEDGFDQAQALFFLGCFMAYLLFSLMTVKSTWPFLAVLFLTAITFLLLSLFLHDRSRQLAKGVRLYWHYHHSLKFV